MEVFKKSNLDSHLNYLNVSDETSKDFEFDISALDIEKQMTKFTLDKIYLNHHEINDF